MIPRLIHFIWLGPTLPSWVSRMIEECRAWHPGPDWRIELWRRMPADCPPAFWQRALKAHQFCMAADLIQIWLLYSRGGIVSDTDSLALRSFENLRECEAFTSMHSARDPRLTNGFVGATPGAQCPA